MKKLIIIFLSLLSIPALCGCGSIYSNYREVEQIKVIQTMGLDYIPGGVKLSLSSDSGGSGSEEPLCFECTGSSISEAMDKIRTYSSEEDLFFAHISRIIIGEEAAKHGIDNYLSYVCRSPKIRIDTPIFIIKGETAAHLMSELSSSTKGVSEVLEAVEANISNLSNRQILNTAEIINSMEKNGGATICALEFTEGAQQNSDSESGEKDMTASISGYAVMNNSQLCSFINMDEAVGLCFLLNRVGISNIIIEDINGEPVTMEISRGGSRLSPRWGDDGELIGIDVFANVSATVLEMEENKEISEAELSDYLISGLESEVSSRIAAVLQLSRKLQTDFLGLGSKIELEAPYKYRSMDSSFIEKLPSLELRVSVSGELCHTKDIKGA